MGVPSPFKLLATPKSPVAEQSRAVTFFDLSEVVTILWTSSLGKKSSQLHCLRRIRWRRICSHQPDQKLNPELQPGHCLSDADPVRRVGYTWQQPSTT